MNVHKEMIMIGEYKSIRRKKCSIVDFFHRKPRMELNGIELRTPELDDVQ